MNIKALGTKFLVKLLFPSSSIEWACCKHLRQGGDDEQSEILILQSLMSFLQAPSRRFLDGNNEISLILQTLMSFFLQAPSQGW
jgi:hypothetical protein